MIMYAQVIIDDSDPGKPIYEQSIHNQQLCIQARFPMFEKMFSYSNGVVTGIRENFKCDIENCGVEHFLYVISRLVASSEKNNVSRFTDPDCLLHTINSVEWVC